MLTKDYIFGHCRMRGPMMIGSMMIGSMMKPVMLASRDAGMKNIFLK